MCEQGRVIFIIAEDRVDEYLGIGSLAACLRASSWQVETYQWSLQTEDELVAILQAGERPCLVGIPWLYVFSEPSVKRAARFAKRLWPDVPVVIGGYSASFEHRRILEDEAAVDFVLRGEAERSIVHLVGCLRDHACLSAVPGLTRRLPSGTVVSSDVAVADTDLDALPSPCRQTLDQKLAIMANPGSVPIRVLSSRGCFARCRFCSIAAFYSLGGGPMQWRSRSLERVVDEIASLKASYGTSLFWFADDEFIGPPHGATSRIECLVRLLETADLGIEFGFDARADGVCSVSVEQWRQLRSLGLRVVSLGLESGAENVLRILRKGLSVEVNNRALDVLQLAGVDYRYGFVMYHPDTTLQELAVNIEFVASAKPHKICNAGPERLLTALFPAIGTEFAYDLGIVIHNVGKEAEWNLPRLRNECLGWVFSDHRVARFRHLLRDIALNTVSEAMLARNDPAAVSWVDPWFGVNSHPRNVQAMAAFLDCHRWLIEHIEESLSDEELTSGMRCVFERSLSAN